MGTFGISTAKLRRSRAGTSATEFALILPILTLLIFGTMHYGAFYFAYNVMLTVARNGARSLAVSTATATQAKATAQAALPAWIPQAAFSVTPSDAATGAQVSMKITLNHTLFPVLPLAIFPTPDPVANVVMIKEG